MTDCELFIYIDLNKQIKTISVNFIKNIHISPNWNSSFIQDRTSSQKSTTSPIVMSPQFSRKTKESIEDTAWEKIFLAWLRLWWGGFGWRKLEWHILCTATPYRTTVLADCSTRSFRSRTISRQQPTMAVPQSTWLSRTRVLARAVWASPSLRAFS